MEVVRTGQGGGSVVGSVVELGSDEWLVRPLHRSRLAAAPQASPAWPCPSSWLSWLYCSSWLSCLYCSSCPYCSSLFFCSSTLPTLVSWYQKPLPCSCSRLTWVWTSRFFIAGLNDWQYKTLFWWHFAAVYDCKICNQTLMFQPLPNHFQSCMWWSAEPLPICLIWPDFGVPHYCPSWRAPYTLFVEGCSKYSKRASRSFELCLVSKGQSILNVFLFYQTRCEHFHMYGTTICP